MAQTTDTLRWGDTINFMYKGRWVKDAMFIIVEQSAWPHDRPDPQPEELFPRIRCMFPGSTFGRYSLSEITELEIA